MRTLLLSWLLLILITSILLAIAIETNVGYERRCLEDQQSLLAKLKSDLVYNSSMSTKLVQWTGNLDYCNWSGVSCYHDGCVIGLDLSNEFISGGIHNSSSLFSLHFMQNLNLASNRFNSTIPFGFERLSDLRVLNMSDSGLLGVFPQSIFKVPNLQTLDLSNNVFLQGSLPEFKFKGPLQNLILHGTNFSGTLPGSIGVFENLTRLDLQSCSFNNSIPNSIAKLRQLTYIDLSRNRFVRAIPSFSLLKNLEVLRLSYNLLDGTLLSTKWEELSNLVVLELRNNSLTGNVPLSLFHIESIQRIQLSYNRFNGSLKELSNVSSFLLDTLHLQSNQLEGPFPLSFFELRGLKILSLSFNNFSGNLNLNMFKQLKNISRLELSRNSLSVDSNDTFSAAFPQMTELELASCKLRRFPEFLKNQSNLVSLDLSDNELQGEIPHWIWELTSLRHLNLSCNSLTGFEGSPQNLATHLDLLDLHSNKFQGPLTFFAPSAYYLDYSNNSFNSILPFDIGKYIYYAVFFSASRNQIQGNIPESLCTSINLKILDLSHNNMGGMFPLCLTKMTTNLVVLNLKENSFKGFIPNTFPSMCGLRTLDLSGNNIGGQVPSSLSNCKDLEVLDLGNNQIYDTFPCQLKNISTMRVLVLRSNQFHGKIGCPTSNDSWLSLQIIDLSRNRFSGDIPGEVLRKWKTMVDGEEYRKSKVNHLRYDFFRFSYVNYQDTVSVISKGLETKLTKILTVFTSIDFSCNDFDGQIPAEIGELTALYLLNLSHNSFSGNIPSSVGHLRQLGSLDLSSNSLSGKIPSQLAGLTFLSFMNLSYNELVGMIPIGTQIQTFLPDSFVGNEGLCGDPLPNECETAIRPFSDARISGEESEDEFEWNYIYIFIAAGFVAGVVTGVIAGLRVWEQQSTTLLKWFSLIINHKRKQRRLK